MKIHFIAIGGSAMHNLAIALHKKNYLVTGSDDEIFEPSRSRLKKYGLLPKKFLWDKKKITKNLDAVILGMHARLDNPELKKAKELNIKIYSYPEYLFEQTKNKTRVVIGGSHGKTSITSMIMHVLKENNFSFDYMVGANLYGFETMVHLEDNSKIAVFEGDEYLSSPIDKRPKFHLYRPHIALISGIAYDHINVFPSLEIYEKQFEIFINLIEKNGKLFFYKNDEVLKKMLENSKNKISKIPYETHNFSIKNQKTFLNYDGKEFPIHFFGEHNLQNLEGAKKICLSLGVKEKDFYNSIKNFRGANRRLEILEKNENTNIFWDFAHSPSKLKASVNAVKNQFKNRKLVSCMELHTFSSLSKNFLKFYKNTMKESDFAFVYFNPETIKHKKLENIKIEEIKNSFAKKDLKVFTNIEYLIKNLFEINWKNKNLLLMSSGNFSGTDIKELSKKLLKNN